MDVHSTKYDQCSGALKRNRGMTEKANIVKTELAVLHSLSHAELKHLWVDTFNSAPPKGLSRRLMVHALAYDLQAQHMGELRPSVRQDLWKIAEPQSSQSSVTTSAKLTPGTRLMREWRGTVHVVDVTKDGLVWNGQMYSSLSAIARNITGTRWSGQRFFGLRKRSDATGSPKATQSTRPNQNRDGSQASYPYKDMEAAKSALPIEAEPELFS